MCHFISLVVSGVNADELGELMRKHGRCAKPILNASLSAVCRPGETQYLTTNAHCDCGTVLASGEDGEPQSEDIETSQLVRRGWSQAKIDRWLEHKRRASERRPARRSIDSFAFWAMLLSDLRSTLTPHSLGVFVHDYSGDLESERFAAKRRRPEAGVPLESALPTLREDELLMILEQRKRVT